MSFRILSTASRTAATSAIGRLSTRSSSSPLSNASSLLSSCTSHLHHNHTKNTILIMRHIVSSTPHRFSSATDDKPDTKTTDDDDDDDDECPPWQNPLHHNNPDHVRTLAEEFSPGEEMPLAPLPPFEMSTDGGSGNTGGAILAPPHLHDIADEIVRLNMLEVKELMDRIGTHFGFNNDDDDDDNYGGGSGVEEGGDGGEGEGAEAAVEQTAFDLKLMGFDAKTKIKVIKEIRAMTSLGLKEAKELVEGAPTTIKKGIKKEEAEELKAKLVELGATIDIV